jgi:hypothetical protein
MDFGSRRFQVVTAVLVVALLGGTFAYYSTAGAGGTTVSSVTSPSSTELSIPGSGGSTTKTQSDQTFSQSSLTVVSSTTLPCTSEVAASGASSAPTSLPDYIPLFSTISSMTMFVQQIIVDQYGRINSTTAVASYTVAGKVNMDTTQAYAVDLSLAANATSYAVVNGTTNSEQAIAYFDQEGDLLLFSQPNLNETGTSAIASAAPYLDWFDYELTTPQQITGYENPTLTTSLNQTAVTLGSTNMTVTYAAPKAIPFSVSQCGGTTIVESVLFAYGNAPGTNTPIITYYVSLGSDGAASETFGYKVVAVTPG